LGWQHDVPDRHSDVPGHVPQFNVLPQPSLTVPHTFPAQEPVGTQQV
jgi:hypothetical protein